jgi:hypothetical protein
MSLVLTQHRQLFAVRRMNMLALLDWQFLTHHIVARWAIAGFRSYVQVALKQERRYPQRTSSSSPENFSQSAAVGSSIEATVEWEQTPSGPQSQTSDEAFSDPNTWVDETGWSPDPTRRRPTDRRREEFFSRLFSPLKFPPELAHRTLTHNSHSMARQGHNAALAFIGVCSL